MRSSVNRACRGSAGIAGVGGGEDAVQVGHALLLVPLKFGYDPGPASLTLVIRFDIVFLVGAVEGIVVPGKADEQACGAPGHSGKVATTGIEPPSACSTGALPHSSFNAP